MNIKERTFFNKKIGDMTQLNFKNKINLKTFIKDIKTNLIPFSNNMENLNKTNNMYPEQWMELFLNWYEIYQKEE